MNTKKFFIAVFFSLFAFFGLLGHANQAHAASTDNVYGRAWSDDTGWMSFNNCTSPTSCSGTDYGVSVDLATGNMSGEAWSSNLGWISFNETSGCPVSGCTTQPKLNLLTGAFTGYIRASSFSVDNGGWDGWISMGPGGPGNAGNGWQMDLSSGSVTGVAWGGLNVGWLVPYTDMKVVITPPPPSSYKITATACSNGNITPPGVTTVLSGADQPYTLTPNTGYAIGSLTVDGVIVTTTNPYTFHNVTANHTISYSCTPDTYTITASSDSNGTISPTSATVSYGSNSPIFTFIPIKSGYSFNSLTDNPPNSSVPTRVGTGGTYQIQNVTSDHTIHVTFSKCPSSCTSYTISTSLTGNGSISPGSALVPKGQDGPLFTITPDSSTDSIESVSDNGSDVISSLSRPANDTYVANSDGTATIKIGNVTADHTISVGITSSGGGCSGSCPPPTYYECNDHADNDNDGFIDFTGGKLNGFPVGPDPQCTSPTDNSESNVKPIYTEN